MVDVRNKVRDVASCADEVGFSGAGEWSVSRGTSQYSFSYCKFGEDSFTRVAIGKTARDAYAWLDAFQQGIKQMVPMLDTPMKLRVMANAMRASYHLQYHQHVCNHCQLHVLGARASWCNQYRKLIAQWKNGLDIAQSIHHTKYPISDVLKFAVAN